MSVKQYYIWIDPENFDHLICNSEEEKLATERAEGRMKDFNQNPFIGVVECSEYESLKSELEATEKVYKMNREYVEDAKLKIKQLEEEISELRLGLYK